MSWFIGILTFFLVINCIILCLLVLAQRPKKDTGGGLAFGSGATDTLFGPGSGDMFTKLTKYGAVAFFVVTMLLTVLHAQVSRSRSADPRSRMTKAEREAEMQDAMARAQAAKGGGTTNAASATTTTNAATNAPSLLLGTPGTNVSAKPTNAVTPSAEKK
jgi:preprotein translocase subunit SecG